MRMELADIVARNIVQTDAMRNAVVRLAARSSYKSSAIYDPLALSCQLSKPTTIEYRSSPIPRRTHDTMNTMAHRQGLIECPLTTAIAFDGGYAADKTPARQRQQSCS